MQSRRETARADAQMHEALQGMEACERESGAARKEERRAPTKCERGLRGYEGRKKAVRMHAPYLLYLHAQIHNVLIGDAVEQILARRGRDGPPRDNRPDLSGRERSTE